MLYLCVPVLNNYSGLERLLQSAAQGRVVPNCTIIVDNGGEYPHQRVPNVEVFRPGRNMGVAASWNYCFRTIYRHYFPYTEQLWHNIVIVIANDDIILDPGTLEAFATAQQHDPSVFLRTNALDNWSLFSQHLASIDTVGYYDEAFFPAYWEDKDYNRRLNLAGNPKQCLTTATCTHDGSRTIRNYEEHELEEKHHRFFRRNREYYIEKWGGLPGAEQFTTPFNR